MSNTRGFIYLLCCLIGAVSLLCSHGTTNFCVGFLIVPTKYPARGLHGDRGAVFKNNGPLLKRGVTARPASAGVNAGEKGMEEEVMVFDAEGAVSWDEYKSKQPDEYKLSDTDKNLCWQNDECPVEDETKYTKAWQLRSAEKDPPTETHFDSEGEWEEENKSAWTKKWYEDVGADDLHVEPKTTPKEGYDI